ncbi:MAG: AraC family transcriptional regulator [Desulfobulbaceae bacterium]|nr:MAG: AraC family transcriptional regulator [Desulfobulbaceae bacterium]
MYTERFFKHEHMPFAEIRYSQGSRGIYKPHLHSTLSIGAVDQGVVRYRVGSEETDLAPGALAIINPEILHTCNPVGGEERSYYMLFLDTSWCCLVQETLFHSPDFIEPSVIKLVDTAIYDLYCQTMEQFMNEQVHLQEKEQLLFDLVSKVFTRCCSSGNHKNETPHDISLLKDLLSEDLQADLTLNSLATKLGTNPYTLIRQFKKITGTTPHAYRMNRRIEMAKKLLRQGCEIAETALECGFFDQSHLHRHFKAMTTVTPRDYQVNFMQ